VRLQTAKKQMQIKGWSLQVATQKQSGQTIRKWCLENGVPVKSFYYHRRRVQEEILETFESINNLPAIGTELRNQPVKSEITSSGGGHSAIPEKSIFAAFQIPQRSYALVTVRIGEFAVDIQNGADDTTIETVLRTVVRL